MPADQSSVPNDSMPTETSAKVARRTAKPTAAASKSKRTFEQAIADVEEIVAKLEGGKLELATSLDEYQRGIGALKECYELLGSAERRITMLSGFDIDGNPVTEPFGEQPMTTEEKQTARPTRRSSKPPRVLLTDLEDGEGLENEDSQADLF